MGLDINLDAFKKMTAKDRDILIYKNVITIKDKIDDYKFHRKIQYVWLALLTPFLILRRFIPF